MGDPEWDDQSGWDFLSEFSADPEAEAERSAEDQAQQCWSAEEKARIVSERFRPGERVDDVARRYGVADPPAVLFRYSRDRSGDHPVKHLKTFTGILQAGDKPATRGEDQVRVHVVTPRNHRNRYPGPIVLGDDRPLLRLAPAPALRNCTRPPGPQLLQSIRHA